MEDARLSPSRRLLLFLLYLLIFFPSRISIARTFLDDEGCRELFHRAIVTLFFSLSSLPHTIHCHYDTSLYGETRKFHVRTDTVSIYTSPLALTRLSHRARFYRSAKYADLLQTGVAKFNDVIASCDQRSGFDRCST